MDLNTAAMTGLKLCGYERPLPIWEEALKKPAGNGHKRTASSREKSLRQPAG
jgi:hypothetical protein